LRHHPIAIEVARMPIEDDILPLTKPVVGTSGKVYTELPIPKGTPITISAIGYNLCIALADPSLAVYSCHCFRDRNKDVWGPDAYEFRPERWLEVKEQVESPVGVYGNLYGHAWSFDAGIEY